MRRTWSLVPAVTVLTGCGTVAGTPVDARSDSGGDAAVNRCAPVPCLLSDEFNGAMVDDAKWSVTTSPGATVSQVGGVLRIRLPAAANAYADVASRIGFGDDAIFEASVTFTAGQFYDHRGVGFASDRISSGCNTGEADAAMFRGQDEDSYVEAKATRVDSCTKTATKYAGDTSKLQIVRAVDHISFRQNDMVLPDVTTNIPTGLLPIRFSAYTFTTAPQQPLQIDVDYVFLRRP